MGRARGGEGAKERRGGRVYVLIGVDRERKRRKRVLGRGCVERGIESEERRVSPSFFFFITTARPRGRGSIVAIPCRRDPAATMLQAWLAHCESLAVEDMASEDVCLAHVARFKHQIRAHGPLPPESTGDSTGGRNPQCCADVGPGLRVLAAAGREFHMIAIVEEILERAKQRATLGQYGMVIKHPYVELKSYQHGKHSELGLIQAIPAALNELGLAAKMCTKRISRFGCGPGDIVITWLDAGILPVATCAPCTFEDH